ncbi:MAG: DNA primase, partial [Streptococcus sp.]|nr:DNA primase [Streptococcus sp.]
MEINIEELQEQLNESKAIEPPKSMKELLDRIYQAGELWRSENKYLVNEGKKNEKTVIPLPSIFTVAKEL